jgi:CRISPR system Cascade subunit CasD
MSKVYSLLMTLEGPMQSWGYRSRFDYRDTALEPTRSGVIGLICAAMGVGRGEDISCFEKIRMGVRVDKKGRPERDYQTAIEVIKADKSGTDTVVSYRDYLADAMFTVGLQSDDENFLNEIAAALRSPVWPLFLGRKAFPLSAPPVGQHSKAEPGSLEKHLLTGNTNKRVVLEPIDRANGERTQNDWPLSFAQRRFKHRSIQVLFDHKGAGE